MSRFVIPMFLFIAFVISCGIVEPDYRDYTDTGTGSGSAGGATAGATTAPPPPTSAECLAAAAEFEAQLNTPMKTCAVNGCHLQQPIAGKALKTGDTSTNRAQLKAYTGATSDKLFNKISLVGVSHSGGNLAATLPKANIDAWLAKEALCL